jgi:calcineurin-like phosphoesterase family protein
MHEALVVNWNARVKRGDRVYHLGDFALKMGVPEVESILRRLNGEKFLIWGNHDQKNKSVMRANGFVERVPYKEIKVGEQKIVMCHYPFVTWNGSYRGSWSLHGHCHGNLVRNMSARRLDVGVDCWNYAPLSFDEVAAEMGKVAFKAVDHHEEMDL